MESFDTDTVYVSVIREKKISYHFVSEKFSEMGTQTEKGETELGSQH